MKQYSYIFLILFFKFIFIDTIKSTYVKNYNIFEKKVNLLGIDYNYAVADINLSEELYYLDGFSCPKFQCSTFLNSTIINNCTCDFTDKGNCPKTNLNCGRKCSIDEYNNCDGDWIVIDQVDKFLTFEINQTTQFRYKVKVDPQQPCRGLGLKIFSNNGFATINIGPSLSLLERRTFSSQRNIFITFCPFYHEDVLRTMTMDTYYFEFIPTTRIYNFTILLHEISIDNNEISANEQCVTFPNNGEKKCLDINKVIYTAFGNNYYFNVTKPDYYLFHAPKLTVSNNQQVQIFISDDPNNQNPSIDNATWQSVEDGDNYLLLFLEPKNETEPLQIFLTVQTQTSGVYFAVSTNIHKVLYPISSIPSIQSGFFNLKGTAQLLLPDNSLFNSQGTLTDAKKKSFSILYPQFDINPTWPPNGFFIDKANTIAMELPNLKKEFKPNTFQFSFLLSKKNSNQYIKYQDFNTIKNSTLKINSVLTNKDGLPVKLNINLNESTQKNQTICDYDQFNYISEFVGQIKSSLINTRDMDQTTSLRYNLDYLQSRHEWSNCVDKINGYFKSNVGNYSKPLKYCPFSINDPNYEKNPCCSAQKAYYECCNPTQTDIPMDRLYDYNNALIKDECTSFDCTVSVLSEYNKTLSNIDQCNILENSINNIGYQVSNVVRECKSVLISPYCVNDNDCSNYTINGKCNLYTRTCIPNFEYLDKKYIECVLKGLPIGNLFYLVNSTTFNNETIDSLYRQNLRGDCIGKDSILDRSTFSFYAMGLNGFDRCNKNTGCLDSTCEIQHDICMEVLLNNEFVFNETRINNCSIFGYCPGDGSCKDSKACYDQCNKNSTPFCGYCSQENITQCHIINGVTNQTTCDSYGSICLLPDGKIISGISEQDCTQKYGKCDSDNCDSTKCATPYGIDAACIYLVINKETCNYYNGTYDSGSYSCLLKNITQQECNILHINNPAIAWVDCSSKPEFECAGVIQNPLVCKSVKASDCSKEQCLSIGGECSDQYYFSNSSSYFYPANAGKCVRNHTFFYKTMGCVFDENDSPMGCFRWQPAYLTKNECELNGYSWWVPSKTKEQCLSYEGCKSMLDPAISQSLPYNYKFNEMTKDQCVNCKDNDWSEKYQWTNKFSWKPAQWLPGIYISKPKWYQPKGYISNEMKLAFSYQTFYLSVQNSIGYQTSESYITESLCRLERIQKSIETLTCTCTNSNIDNPSQCFQSSIPSIGQIKVCSGESSSFQFDFGEIKFDKDSINQTCSTFTISQISKSIYTSSSIESLASNFVSYKRQPSYSIQNSNDATIGTILSDGIMIQSQDGINKATVCFKKSFLGQYDKDYPVLDVAIQYDNNSKPIPLELSKNSIINDDEQDEYCNIISPIPIGSPIYFQIYRIKDDDWKTKKKELFDGETKVLMYILAILFLLVSLFGFFEIGIIIYYYISKRIISFQIIQSLIGVCTIFIIIRSIYFFLLVNGKLQDSPVLDYILVVLPTFIYFTAFTIIIAIWYVIVFLVLKNNRGSGIARKLYSIIFSINLLLYLFFIAIVLVFQYTPFEPNNDCGSRIFIPNQNSDPQKAISLAYAIVQAALSLIIGSAFIYLGRSLYKTIGSNKRNLSNSNHQKKIFILSAICSIGFILHCVFVIVLVTNINSITFSFIGLVITEIIPIISILYCFNPLDQNNNNTNSSKDGVPKNFKNNQYKTSKQKNTSKLSDNFTSSTENSEISANNSNHNI